MGGPGDKMWITWTFPIFQYFSAKTDPETETEVLGRAKTETEFKIPQPPNTSTNTKNQTIWISMTSYRNLVMLRETLLF